MFRTIIYKLLFIFAFVIGSVATPASAGEKPLRRYAIGNLTSATPGTVSGGLLLMGGGDRHVDAIKWFFGKAGHGHIVVLRASQGGEIGEEFFREVGGVESVETFVFSDRSAATDPRVLRALRRADGIFIAGGDQARYVRFWHGTPVAELLDAHVAAGKPLAGTSAGLAMLGEYLYGAMDDGSITSREALADPFGPANTIEQNFLHLTLLKGIVTDTHFRERDRLGRLVAFVAKAQQGRPADQPQLFGLGVDESASLAVEPDGTGRIYTVEPGGGAWLVDGASLRNLEPRGPLTAPRIRVVGIGVDSVLHLLTREVERPAFTRNYAVRAGEIVEVPRWALSVHGGAGVLDRAALTPERALAYRTGLQEAMRAGAAVLEQGGTSLDAVGAAIRVLEDNPLFNAGRGAVFTAEGRNELDASVMDGRTLRAGAVAGVTRTRHPIDLARAVMDHSPHVMLTGAGADAFAAERGLEQVDPSWFRTEERWQQLLAWRRRQQGAVDPTHLFGTVGAVAIDAEGNLAAGTSTGGMTGKRWGRVGDSPIIGAGTYARNGDCAVSATGSGEYFIRESAARQLCDRVAWNHESLISAAKSTIAAVGAIGGDGGLIAMGPDGRATFALNDIGMYRGRMVAGGAPETAIFAEDPWTE